MNTSASSFSRFINASLSASQIAGLNSVGETLVLPRAHRTVCTLFGSYSHRKPQGGPRKEKVGEGCWEVEREKEKGRE